MKLTQLLIIRDNDVLEQEQESLEAETADQSPENLPFWSPDEQIDDLVSALKDSQLGTEVDSQSPGHSQVAIPQFDFCISQPLTCLRCIVLFGKCA